MQVDWFKSNSFKYLDKMALVEFGFSNALSFRELNERANSFASDLQFTYNLKKGDKVVVVSSFSTDLISLFGAALKTGIVIVPINYRLNSEEISSLIEKVNANLLISDSCVEAEANCKKTSFSDFTSHTDKNYVKVDLCEDDDLFVFFTSGSTGEQKAVRYTHKMLYWNMLNAKDSLAISKEDVSIATLPPFHSGGWNILLTPLLMNGGTVVINNYAPEKFFDIVSLYSVNKLVLIPTQMKMLYDAAVKQKSSVSKIDTIVVGGESLAHSLIDKWHDLDIKIRQGYGLTEAGPGITSLGNEYVYTKKGSVGKPNKYVDLEIVNTAGVPVKDYEIGEIVIRGNVVMPSYLFENSNNSASWFYTGDLAYRDSDGFIFILDRKDDMYISGGENIYPSEVEKHLLSFEEIEEACVIGVDDEKWGKVGCAFVKLSDSFQFSGEKVVFDRLKSKIAKFKIPKKIIVLDSLPVNELGKTDRKQLKKNINTILV